MRTVKIVSRTFDKLAHIEFTPIAVVGETTYSRRVTRTATLDGGSAFTDRGFSHSDRELVYAYRPISKEHDNRAKRIIQLHETVTVANEDGIFEAVPVSFEPAADENVITLFVKRDLTEE